jgi:hypothetical protein
MAESVELVPVLDVGERHLTRWAENNGTYDRWVIDQVRRHTGGHHQAASFLLDLPPADVAELLRKTVVSRPHLAAQLGPLLPDVRGECLEYFTACALLPQLDDGRGEDRGDGSGRGLNRDAMDLAYLAWCEVRAEWDDDPPYRPPKYDLAEDERDARAVLRAEVLNSPWLTVAPCPWIRRDRPLDPERTQFQPFLRRMLLGRALVEHLTPSREPSRSLDRWAAIHEELAAMATTGRGWLYHLLAAGHPLATAMQLATERNISQLDERDNAESWLELLYFVTSAPCPFAVLDPAVSAEELLDRPTSTGPQLLEFGGRPIPLAANEPESLQRLVAGLWLQYDPVMDPDGLLRPQIVRAFEELAGEWGAVIRDGRRRRNAWHTVLTAAADAHRRYQPGSRGSQGR